MRKRRRLTEDEKEKIRKLQESGMSDTEISRMLGIPRSTVYYQRCEVKKRRRENLHRPENKERRRRYYQSKRSESDPEFKELVELINSYEKGWPPQGYSERNTYISILKHLYQNDRCGLRHRHIKRRLREDGFEFRKLKEIELSSGYKVTKEIEGVLTFKLKKLMDIELVEYNKEKRYFLTDGGREFCKYLFEEKCQKEPQPSIAIFDAYSQKA